MMWLHGRSGQFSRSADGDGWTCCCVVSGAEGKVLCAELPNVSQELPGEWLRLSADQVNCGG